jgi:hypothetical protein
MFRLAAAFLLSCFSVFAATVPRSDFEVWPEIDLTAAIGRDMNVTVPFVARASNAFTSPQLYGLGPLVDWNVEQRVTLTAGYLYVSLPHTGPGFSAHVPLAAITLNGRLGKFSISDRNRGERLYGIPGNPFRYRNKVSIEHSLIDGRLNGYVSEETFYDTGQSAWSQIRVEAGVGAMVSPRVRVDCYYLRRGVRRSLPAATNGLGITLRLGLNSRAREAKHENH